MATSGSITTNACEARTLTLSWSLSSQSVAGNYSNVSWSLTGCRLSVKTATWAIFGGHPVT